MEKADAIVAGVGALILAVAIVATALTGGGAQSFELVVTTSDVELDGGSLTHTTDAVVRDVFTFVVAERNATRLNITVSVSFLPAPSAQASMRAVLTSPNGTAYEHAGRVAEATPTQSVASTTFDIAIAPRPASVPFEGTREEAARAVEALGSTEGMGNWTIEVSFSAGLAPVPATSSWRGTLSTFHVEPQLAVPVAR